MRLKGSLSKYDVQQGFQQHLNTSQPIIQLNKDIHTPYLIPHSKDKAKSRLNYKKQQPKLRYISIQRQNNRSSHYDYLKEQQSKFINQSMTLHLQDKQFSTKKKRNSIPKPINKLPPLQNYSTSVSKIKRSEVGQNLQFIQFNSLEVKLLKQNLINEGVSLVFQDNRQSNSHGLFKKYLKSKNSNNFLKSKYNKPLLQKINSSYINPKNQVTTKLNQINNKKGLQFISDFESSNLDFVTQINPFQYDIYVKADTNTMGHQNWFYFKLLNNSQDKKDVFLNVSNLKRGFKMVKRGQKIHYRLRKIIKGPLKTSIQNQQEQWSDWQKIQEQVTIASVYQNIPNQQNKKRRVYKLSFSASLLPQMQYEFSLLPPFTYSQLLKQIQIIQKNSKYVEVQTLTFSLLGMCIPLLTFTNKEVNNLKKNVILISARIHPGQTCASYVVKGVMKKLSQENQQNDQFLSNHIIKIIPMINPDGVVLGNFRTNYMGSDLNRSFNQQNQVTFPQIVGLKNLGRKLKQQHKQKFICFLDLHGHSSQKSIFVYGPNYDENHKHFINSRFFPKTLSYLAQQFSYDKCTFTLQQCKSNTARAFFLKSLKTMAFTIQSSYALFDSNKNPQSINQDLKIQNWIDFGHNIIKALQIWTKSKDQNQSIKEIEKNDASKLPQDYEKVQGQALLFIGKIKKDLMKQSSNLKKKIKKRKNTENDDQQSSAQDTDGQSQSQDISVKEREKLQRKLIQINTNANIFPRILRPAIIHPQVNPTLPLFSVSKINPIQSSSTKGSIINLRKKNRYQNGKSVSANNAYTQYLLKQVKGLQFLRPSVNLMKISTKESSLMRSSNLQIK